MFILTLVSIAIFIFAALPLKNWLEIKRAIKKDSEWTSWLLEKPNREEYCLKTGQSSADITCDYCRSNRQVPSLEMVIEFNPKFGILSNTIQKYSHFKTYICSGCGTQLFRERYEE